MDGKSNIQEPTEEFPVSIRITKAVSEGNTIIFTIVFKTTLPGFGSSTNEVLRSHSDFIWLHQALKNDESVSYVHIPPAPTLPNFGFSSEFPSLVTADNRERAEKWIHSRIESNYSSLFQRALNMHENFLVCLSQKKHICDHHFFQMFLKSDIRLASTEGAVNSFMNFANKIYKKIETKIAESGATGLLLDAVDEELERTKVFLKGYIEGVSGALEQDEKVINRGHTITVDMFNAEQSHLDLSEVEVLYLPKLYQLFADCFSKNRKLTEDFLEEEEFLLVDLLRYYLNDSNECLDLIYYRTRLLSKVAKAKQNFSKAQSSGRGVIESKVTFESMEKTLHSTTDSIREDLNRQSEERIKRFSNNMLKLCERGIKTSTEIVRNLQNAIGDIENEC